jgi:hypothetical protein
LCLSDTIRFIRSRHTPQATPGLTNDVSVKTARGSPFALSEKNNAITHWFRHAHLK